MVQALGPCAVHTYHPLIEAETYALLKRILSDPQDYHSYIRRYVPSVQITESTRRIIFTAARRTIHLRA